MVTLSAFRRRVSAGDRSAEVELRAGEARWVGAQEHAGENIGDSMSHSTFIELKEPPPTSAPTIDAPLAGSVQQPTDHHDGVVEAAQHTGTSAGTPLAPLGVQQ
jgi:hypothetical protein